VRREERRWNHGGPDVSTRYPLRPHDFAFFAAIASLVLFLFAVARGSAAWALAWAALTVATTIAARRWSRRYPGPMPSAIRWALYLAPHATGLLVRVLRPVAGERILEIGPGVGHHALAVAPALAPGGGTLEVLDLQPEMLDAVIGRARDAGIANVVARRGDAQELPYADASFDGAYLSAVLGEIPDRRAALRELRRVLKPGGRLVVAEVLLDPDYVPLGRLREDAGRAGFAFEERFGPSFAYVARFRASP
jgi:SAM-dependent methyltransferase